MELSLVADVFFSYVVSAGSKQRAARHAFLVPVQYFHAGIMWFENTNARHGTRVRLQQDLMDWLML